MKVNRETVVRVEMPLQEWEDLRGLLRDYQSVGSTRPVIDTGRVRMTEEYKAKLDKLVRELNL